MAELKDQLPQQYICAQCGEKLVVEQLFEDKDGVKWTAMNAPSYTQLREVLKLTCKTPGCKCSHLAEWWYPPRPVESKEVKDA